jgi:nitronate monooxygenase
MSFGTDASGERRNQRPGRRSGARPGRRQRRQGVPAAELIARFKKEYDAAIDSPL